MGAVTWDKVERPEKSFTGKSNRDKFLKLEGGKSYTIRPVHLPVEFYKFFHKHNGQVRTSVCDRATSESVHARYPEVQASLKYAINVIDRSDGKLKILEGPPTIFEELRKFFDMTGDAPGSASGGDFQISVIIPDNNDRRRTRYTVKFVGKRTPFTEEEIAMIESVVKDFKLTDIYKSSPEEEVIDRLFSDTPKRKDGSGDEGGAEAEKKEVPSDKKDVKFNW